MIHIRNDEEYNQKNFELTQVNRRFEAGVAPSDLNWLASWRKTLIDALNLYRQQKERSKRQFK